MLSSLGLGLLPAHSAHAKTRLVIVSLALTLQLGTSARSAAPDATTLEEAAELGKKATQAKQALRYLEAAEYLDAANRLQPHPKWLALSGYCRMMAGEQQRAIADFSAALENPGLAAPDRAKALERLELARGALAAVLTAEVAEQKGDFAAAARAYEKAQAIVDSGVYLLEAAASWERAEELRHAQSRYRDATARKDLSPVQMQLSEEGLARVTALWREPEPWWIVQVAPAKLPPPGGKQRGLGVVVPPEHVQDTKPAAGTYPTLGVVFTGVGAASTLFGAIAFIMAEDRRDKALDEEGEVWWNTGLVTGSVGIGALVTGIVLIVTHDDGTSEPGKVEVGAFPVPGGGLVTATSTF